MTDESFEFRHTSTIAGLFVIAAVLLLVVGIFCAAHYQGWMEGNFQVRSHFTTDEGALGLQEGSEVRIRNTLAGHVGKILPTSDGRMETTFIIKESFKPFVKKDSVPKVKMKFGVAGDSFVEIGMGKGVEVQDGDSIGDCTKDEELMETANRMLDEVRKEVVPLLEEVKGILKNVNGITASIDHGKGLAGTAVNDEEFAGNVKDLMKNINRTVNTIDGAVRSAQVTVQESTRLVKAMQNHWLLRSYVEGGDVTVPFPGYLTAVENAQLKESLAAELEKSRMADDSSGIVRNATALAACLMSDGGNAEAARLLDEAKCEAGVDGNAAVKVQVLVAELARLAGKTGDAIESGKAAVRMLGRSSEDSTRILSHAALARAYCDTGNSVEAESELKEIESVLGHRSPLFDKSLSAEIAGRIFAIKGEAEKAGSKFDSASAFLKEAGLHFGMAVCMEKAGEAYEKAGRATESADRYFRAGRTFVSGGDGERAKGILKRAAVQAEKTRNPALARQIGHLLDGIPDKNDAGKPKSPGSESNEKTPIQAGA